MSEIFEHKYLEGKDSEGYFVPLQDANTFINQICDNYDPSFRDITVYGSNEYPLFVLKDIREVLKIPRKTLEDNVNKFEDYEILKNQAVKIETRRGESVFMQKKEKVNMLTKFGVYAAMFISNSNIGKVFKKFIYIVLDKLEMDKVVKLEDAQKALHKSIEKLADERDTLLVRNHYYREDNARLRTIEDCTSTKEAFAIDGTPEYKIVCLMKNKFFHKTPIYIVNPDYVNAKYSAKPKRRKSEKKPRDDSADELVSFDEKEETTTESLEDVIDQYDLLQYEIPYNEIFPGDLAQYPDMEFYIHLPSFRSKAEKKQEVYQYVGDIQVLNKEHLSAIKAYYDTDKFHTTKMKHVYRTTYADLMSILDDHISANLFELTK
jgi:hypothetical protein